MVPTIPPVSIEEFYGSLGRLDVVNGDTEILMDEYNYRRWAEDEFDSPHEHAWHVSFHGSEFPGDHVDACARFLTYRMMNFPPVSHMPAWVTTTGDVGKAGELSIARAWFWGGRMLAIPEGVELGEGYPSAKEIHQLGFELPEVWMTCSTDLPVLKEGWHKPHIIEVKCKAHDVIESMQLGKRSWDVGHRRQLLATIGSANRYDWGEVTVCRGCWRIHYADIYDVLTGVGRLNPAIGMRRAAQDNLQFCPWCNLEQTDPVTFQLEAPDTGSIYYWSRSWPRQTSEYLFNLDQSFMDAGIEVLRQAREDFIHDRIPERDPSFMWSMGKCKDCPMKKFACKPDFVKATHKEKLSESNGVEFARSLRPHYDPDVIRERVFARWS